MIFYLALALSFAILITAAVWPVPYRIDRKLPCHSGETPPAILGRDLLRPSSQ
jgi:hypothetical protein